MTKRERIAQALTTRNEACVLAEQTYFEEIEKLSLPDFKIDFSETMRVESKRQELLKSPVLEEYRAARHRAFEVYKATK